MGYAQTNPYGYYITLGSNIREVAVPDGGVGASVSVGSFNIPATLSGHVITCYIDWTFRTVEDLSGFDNQIGNAFKAYLYQGATPHEILNFNDPPYFFVNADSWRSGGYFWSNKDVHSYLNFGADQYVYIETPIATTDWLVFRNSQVVLRMWCI